VSEGLERLRRVTSEALLEHFAQEHLTLEEFERRIARSQECDSAPALKALLSGLPGRGPAPEGGP